MKTGYEVTTFDFIEGVEQYLRDYVAFTDDRYFLPLALFSALTHCWDECFDEIPYMVITAATKRAGKSRLMELLAFLANKPIVVNSISVAALYNEVENNKPTLFIDEAEKFNTPNSQFRPVLNGGYRRGQVVLRKIGNENKAYHNYCPKVFTLIGDVYDSLRDRCIIVMMKRGKPRHEFVYSDVEERGTKLREAMRNELLPRAKEIRESYMTYHRKFPAISFLNDRDREGWKPLFTLCRLFAPKRIHELERAAVDISALKTIDIRKYDKLAEEERALNEAEFGERLLRDMITVMKDRRNMATNDVVTALRDLDTAPWRVYKGDGITDDKSGAMLMANLLSRFAIAPKTIRLRPRSRGGANGSTAKGYELAELVEAAKKYGIPIPRHKS